MNRSHVLPVESGKYTFVMYEHDYRVHVLRHDLPWMIIEKGHNALFALLMEAIDAKETIEKLEKQLKNLGVADDKIGEDPDIQQEGLSL